MASNLYRNQTGKTPSLKTLGEIATDLGFDIPEDELPYYRGERYIQDYRVRCIYNDTEFVKFNVVVCVVSHPQATVIF